MKISRKTAILLVLAILLTFGAGGAYLWYNRHAGQGEGGTHQHGALQYTCPMHPFIIKDKPGACPICGMTLVPVKKADDGKPKQGELEMLEHVSLSPTQMVMANVATVKVDRAPLAKEISAVGIVQYDQSRQAKVTAWVAGRIDRLYVNTVGAWVSKGRAVAEIYSPDLVSAQQEYLLALKSREQLKDSPIPSISQGGEGLVGSARQRLKLLGVKDHQIAALEKTGQPNIRLSIYTPLAGIVIEKLVLQGQYVNVGDPLFTIADLSTVWVEAEVYESDFSFIKIGQKVDIDSQSYPGKTFTGRVSFIYPFLDPKTRTVKVRVEIANPGLRLKPDMFVKAAVKIPLGDALVVPVAAVMDNGKRQVVWQEIKPGMFAPRDVKIGARVGDSVQILSGLMRGDKVAASGGYLIDSEAQLKGGGGSAGMPGMKMDEKVAPVPPAGHQGHVPVAPPERKKDDMNMDDMKM
jgi:Cu(I)/Ag(I) efflux system membrane fusion protein